MKFSDSVWHEIALSRRIRWYAHGPSQSSESFAHPPQFDMGSETGVVCGPSHPFDAPHASAGYHWFDPEALRKRIPEERSIDVPEETAKVMVGGPKFYGTSRCLVLKRL